ncbi:hypothetical protein [Usitatibacter palustris]|uniref:Uncharacterized protein n=1 Tax=Usitatibacter palustris TaxID=2732487 RepID=A0A6M4HAX8_9PROT|nr:hypothetical protein [Usitatibacter palustris]QJR16275.1 hypothetical protein DSM104440_03104 [Usitatibacter palustris]
MDQETLKLLAKVKVSARKALGLEIDVQRLTHDRNYASEVLSKATQSDSEDLVLAAITLQDTFGLLSEKPKLQKVENAEDEGTEKYKFGARG